MTRRRDYRRSLQLPGYWSFTNHVRKTVWQHKRLYLGLIIFYAALTMLFVGLGSQDAYTQLGTTLHDSSGNLFTGGLGEVGKAGLLLLSTATGSLNANLSAVQQVYATILVLLTWLSTVWLLRTIVAGHTPKLRDGLYNSGAPIMTTFLVSLVLIVQLLPIALAAIGFNAANATGLLNGGIEEMLFWFVASLLTILSLYWITSTLLALVVVTLPGMYPMKAIKIAGDLIIGRRLRVLLRILWLGFIIAIVWAIIMIPIIIFDAWLKGMVPSLQGLPLVPVALVLISSLTVVWAASYIYLLYRRIVDDDAAPA
ncbi:MAG: hypothetical protein ACHQTE_02270 [Candidatus Saccharimonadales bacterium]